MLWFNEKNERVCFWLRARLSGLSWWLKNQVIMEADYASVSQSQSVHHSGLNDDVSLFNLFSLRTSTEFFLRFLNISLSIPSLLGTNF